jgi:TonB family protein
MKYRMVCAATFGLWVGQAAWADLTMRHTMEFQFGSFLPPTAMEAMKGQLGELPKESIVQIKGQKAYTSMGRMVMIGDYGRGVITLMDPKTRRFAVSPMAAYGEKVAAAQHLPQFPPQVRQMFENMKLDVKTERTGQTATIQGIRGEENLITISLEIPNPSGASMQMRAEMHQLQATPDEVKRLPALQELAVYAGMPKAGMDPVELATKALAAFPGLADKIRGPLAELAKNRAAGMLRMRTALYMPAIAQMAGGAADQPVTEFKMELTELSSAPLPDSRFEVPAEYQSAPMEELIAALFPSPKVTTSGPGTEGQAREPGRAAPLPRTGPPPPGVFRVGGGVTPPHLLSKTEPSYTEEARAARIQGTVLVYVVVGPDGVPQRMRVLRSLDPGLDQKAMEAVGTWKFAPGMKDGKPVSVEAQIEVNFRLL